MGGLPRGGERDGGAHELVARAVDARAGQLQVPRAAHRAADAVRAAGGGAGAGPAAGYRRAARVTAAARPIAFRSRSRARRSAGRPSKCSANQASTRSAQKAFRAAPDSPRAASAMAAWARSPASSSAAAAARSVTAPKWVNHAADAPQLAMRHALATAASASKSDVIFQLDYLY